MARLALKALAAALLLTTPLHAQQARVVTSCGSLAPFGPNKAGTTAFPTQDITGKLCLSGGGGGSSTLTAGTTATSGFTAGQLMMSDGAKLQAVGAAVLGTGTVQFNGAAFMYGTTTSVPHVAFTRDTTSWLDWGGVSIFPGPSNTGVVVDGTTVGNNAGGYAFTSNGSLTARNVGLGYESAGVASIKNFGGMTVATALRVYNTQTDASNGEWAALDWKTTPNVLTIGTQKNGTGTARAVNLVGSALQMNGVVGVSCATGTVTAATMVVTNGIVTHC